MSFSGSPDTRGIESGSRVKILKLSKSSKISTRRSRSKFNFRVSFMTRVPSLSSQDILTIRCSRASSTHCIGEPCQPTQENGTLTSNATRVGTLMDHVKGCQRRFLALLRLDHPNLILVQPLYRADADSLCAFIRLRAGCANLSNISKRSSGESCSTNSTICSGLTLSTGTKYLSDGYIVRRFYLNSTLNKYTLYQTNLSSLIRSF